MGAWKLVLGQGLGEISGQYACPIFPSFPKGHSVTMLIQSRLREDGE